MLATLTLILTLTSLVGALAPGGQEVARGLFGVLQEPDFDWQGLALILGGISLSGIAVMLIGSFLFPEIAERAKRTFLPNVIIGFILLGVGTAIIAALGGG